MIEIIIAIYFSVLCFFAGSLWEYEFGNKNPEFGNKNPKILDISQSFVAATFWPIAIILYLGDYIITKLKYAPRFWRVRKFVRWLNH